MQLELITIHVDKLKESLQFYQEVLGMEEIKRLNPRPEVEIVFLEGENGGVIELISGEEATPASQQGRVSIGFTVADLAATIKELKIKGIELVQGPIETPNGTKLAFIQDPNEVNIEFIENLSL